MNCCQCQGIEEVFSQEHVDRELSRYRTKGPNKTTHLLTDAILAAGVEGQTLLDIGGGVGAIQHAFSPLGWTRLPVWMPQKHTRSRRFPKPSGTAASKKSATITATSSNWQMRSILRISSPSTG